MPKEIFKKMDPSLVHLQFLIVVSVLMKIKYKKELKKLKIEIWEELPLFRQKKLPLDVKRNSPKKLIQVWYIILVFDRG